MILVLLPLRQVVLAICEYVNQNDSLNYLIISKVVKHFLSSISLMQDDDHVLVLRLVSLNYL
jgi:uncharacterized membrane protein